MILETFKDTLNEFLKSNAFYISLAVVGVCLIAALIFILIKRRSK